MGTYTNAVAATTRVGNARWIIAAICFLAYLVAFFDRTNVSVLIANTGFTEAFGITADKSAQGMLLTAFLLCYGLSCFFAGPIVKFLGPRRALGVGITAWAVLMGVMGSTSSFLMLILCRALLGPGEAVLGPSVSQLVQTWFPVHERAKANGIWFNAIQIAAMVAMPLITWLVITGGWRMSFYALAAIGVIPAICFYLYVYNDPSKNPRITLEELEYIRNGMPETKAVAAGGFGFLKDSSFWLNSIVYAAIMAGYWGFMGWVPSYLSKTLGFTFAKMGLVASLPYIAGTIAVFIVTPIMDRYKASAAISVVCCAGFGLLLFMSMFATDKTVAVALLVMSAVFLMPVFPAVFTILQSTSKPSEIANATGVFNGVSFTFSAFFPYLIGAIYTSTGDLRNGFYLLVGVMVVGTLAGIPLIKRRL